MDKHTNNSMFISKPFQEFFKNSQLSLIINVEAPDFKVLAVSDQYLRLVYKKREEVIGRGLFDVFPGNASDESEQLSVYRSFERVISTVKQDILPAFKYEIQLAENGEKETFYWSNINDPVCDEAGQVTHIINTTVNITDQIQQQALLADARLQIQSLQREQLLNEELTATNEQLLLVQQEMLALNEELEIRVAERTQSLTESESRFRNMAENTAVLIAVSDQNNLPVYYNYAWTVLTGHTTKKLLDTDFRQILHPFDQESFFENVNYSRERLQAWKMEFRVVDKDFKYRWLLGNGTPRYGTDGTFEGFVTSCTDITENKEQQNRLEEINLQLSIALKGKEDANIALERLNDELITIQGILVQNNVQLADNEQDLIDVNQRLLESEQILKMAIQSSNMGTWQVDLQSNKLMSSEKSQQIHGVPDGECITIRDFLSMIAPDAQQSFISCIKEAIAAQTSFITEYMIYPLNQSEPKWIRLSGVVRVDNRQHPISILGTILDVTEQKQDEVRKNDFIGMVSHELKTPLTSINGYIQILLNRINNDNLSLPVSLLEKAGKQTKKMIKMINGFLNVSRLESGKILIENEHFEISLLCREIEDETRMMVPSHIFEFYPIEEVWLYADKNKLGQVIENLISNAVKYSAPGTAITVSAIQLDDNLQVSVSDQGMGIDPEDHVKLFDRFYRGKSNPEGISGFGIGLYLCNEIINRLHGKLWVKSEPGVGSVFYFTVPLAVKTSE